jgi:hypothetical protein
MHLLLASQLLLLLLLLQLERKRNKRRLAANKLQDEHDQLLLHSRAMDLLVQHQDTVTRSAAPVAV